MRMMRPQKPNLELMTMEVPNLLRMPSKIMDQIWPSTMPPMRLGMKNTVRKRLLPLMFWVRA